MALATNSWDCVDMSSVLRDKYHNLSILLSIYGIFGLLSLINDRIFTFFAFPGARLVRRPVYIRGKSKISFGRGFTTGVGVRLDVFSDDSCVRLVIGNDVQINDYVHIGVVERVEIGNGVLIASKVFISDHNHGRYDNSDPESSPSIFPLNRPLAAKPVLINDRVWIGEHVCILPGVTIGEGAVIGAGSVVTRDVSANTIVAGNPARAIRVYDEVSGAWQKI